MTFVDLFQIEVLLVEKLFFKRKVKENDSITGKMCEKKSKMLTKYARTPNGKGEKWRQTRTRRDAEETAGWRVSDVDRWAGQGSLKGHLSLG